MLSTETSFVILQTLLNTKLIKAIDHQLNIHGISFTEYLILHYLEESPQQAMRRIDLAERIGISASGVTRVLAPMEKIGLIEKVANPRDARVSLVKLSRAGERLFAEAAVGFEHSAKTFTTPLSQHQLNKLIELQGKLIR